MKRQFFILSLLLSLTPAALAQSVGGLAKGEDLPTLYELTAHSAVVVTARPSGVVLKYFLPPLDKWNAPH